MEESIDIKSDTKMNPDTIPTDDPYTETSKEPEKYLEPFQCSICNMTEKYEYFGRSPQFLRTYQLSEECYVIEDPFKPLKSGEILIIGSSCKQCNSMVCKDMNCSIYFNGTHCIKCAKKNIHKWPKVLQDKINRIV